MSLNCKFCGTNCSVRGRVICGICKGVLHQKCALQEDSSLNTEVVEALKKSDSGLLFRCKACSTNSSSSVNVSSHDSNSDSSKLGKLEDSIQVLTKVINEQVISQLSSIQSELEKSLSNTKKSEELFNSKIHNLEIANNILRRQLNRCDILINGLPKDLNSEEIYSIVFKIGEILDIDVQHFDINMCTYIRGKKEILVKFNCAYKRDLIVMKYFKTRTLKLKDLNIRGKENQLSSTAHLANSEARIYINEHLTPQAAKLKYMCRKMLKDRKIKKFKFFNRDIPQAKITLNDGAERIFDLGELTDYFQLALNNPEVVNMETNN